MTDRPESQTPREPMPAAPFDHVGLVRRLLLDATHATLGTLAEDGSPFATLVALALDEDRTPVIITSHLSHHTTHMERDPRVSLLVAAVGKGDPLAHPRVTLSCRAVAAHVDTADYARIRPIYLAANPKAQIYIDLPGFWFWRLEPGRVALNGGFGKAWAGSWDEIRGS